MNTTPALGSFKALPAFEPAGNGFIDAASKEHPLSSNLQHRESAEKAGSGDDRDLNNTNSIT